MSRNVNRAAKIVAVAVREDRENRGIRTKSWLKGAVVRAERRLGKAILREETDAS